ncbi:MAG: BLUF domain-containing protein [Proteobacteria bacterium]|nr:BLUF domain-containing protein [Pseudomonadota bacterium]
MWCIAYLSSAVTAQTSTELEAILAASRRNNQARGVTGMLCHYDGSFLQFLEGEQHDVETVLSAISADPRHQGILVLYRRELDARLFPDWSMALARPDAIEPEQRAFCHGLRELEVSATPEHRRLVQPFLESFRAWMR